jgi:hypothetical protein
LFLVGGFFLNSSMSLSSCHRLPGSFLGCISRTIASLVEER